jgi:hypothetical protein
MRVIAILLSMLLGSCATAYQQTGLTGGYEDVRLGPDRYRISVVANGLSSLERAEQIVMLRAAELTLRNGFQKFVVEEREMIANQETRYGGAPGVVMTVRNPTGHIVVRMFKGSNAPPKGAHDARAIEADLRPRLAGG